MVSSTNNPPIIPRTNSCLLTTLTAPIAPPTDSEPVSPMKIIAGGALNQRKPRLASLGFLWFNAPPAMIFMGDTGSLSVGGAIGAVSVVSKHELVLGIIGGLFVLETISVIVQVISFKLTGQLI